MFKYIIMSIIVALFTACSAPKPTQAPSWYTSKPKDFKFFYAVGSGESITSAKNDAIANMRNEIIQDLNSKFKNKTTKIIVDTQEIISQIIQENEKLINTMSLSGLKVEKTAKYNAKQLILLKLSRKAVFDNFNAISLERFKESRLLYNQIKHTDPLIKTYSILNKNMELFPKLASITQAKETTLSTDVFKDIDYLNTMIEQYSKLKNELSIYLLSDMDSRIYVKSLKDALSSTGLKLNPKSKSDASLKLIITSDTENKQEYGFYRSKALVKYTTYDLNKNKVAFRQHTFSAKSRKSYRDAKAQTIMHQKSMISKLGVFNFIGVK